MPVLRAVHSVLARGTDDALMVCRVKDNDKVAAIMKKNGVKLVSQEDLMKM